MPSWRRRGKGLWEAAGTAGLNDTQIGRLRLQGKLALLAGNSAHPWCAA